MKKTGLCLATVASLAIASTVVPHSLDDRVRLADRVVFAQVIAQRTENIGSSEKPKLVSYHRVLIAEDLKGSGPLELEVMQVGGKWGLWEEHASDDAHFELGETAVLLLTCPKQLQVCRLSGLADSKLDVTGDDVTVHDMFDGSVRKQKLFELREHLKQVKGVPEVITVRGAQ